MDTWWYYKAAHLIDQSWSVRAAGRQRHIDQAQSMNLYITKRLFHASGAQTVFGGVEGAGVKTIYYVRSKALEVEDLRKLLVIRRIA